MKTRQELFEELGLSKETAALADTASHKPPNERNTEEKAAIHEASEAIFKSDSEDKND